MGYKTAITVLFGLRTPEREDEEPGNPEVLAATDEWVLDYSPETWDAIVAECHTDKDFMGFGELEIQLPDEVIEEIRRICVGKVTHTVQQDRTQVRENLPPDRRDFNKPRK